jgi:hypothetical protein
MLAPPGDRVVSRAPLGTTLLGLRTTRNRYLRGTSLTAERNGQIRLVNQTVRPVTQDSRQHSHYRCALVGIYTAIVLVHWPLHQVLSLIAAVIALFLSGFLEPSGGRCRVPTGFTRSAMRASWAVEREDVHRSLTLAASEHRGAGWHHRSSTAALSSMPCRSAIHHHRLRPPRRRSYPWSRSSAVRPWSSWRTYVAA